MDDRRDADLGRRLELIEEPEHGAEYWDTIRAGIAENVAPERRRTTFGRLRAALTARPLRIALAAAALAAIVAAAVLFGLPRTEGPQPVRAADVVRRALSAYSSGRTWQADVLMKAPHWNESLVGFHYDHLRYRIAQSADGSYRLTRLGRAQRDGYPPATATVTDVLAYDASTGVLGHYRPGRGLTVTRNVPLGPPDTHADPLTGCDLGTIGRALQASGAFTLQDTVVDGRPAWTVTCTEGQVAGLPSPAPLVDWPVYEVTVDKRTWLPAGFREVTAGVLTAEVHFLDVRHDAPLPAGAFTVDAPHGEALRRVDAGFRRITLEEARATPSITPLVPGFAPQGFRLAHAAVAPRALTNNHLVKGRDIFELQYTRGFDAITVSTRTLADLYYKATEDPVDSYNPGWTGLVRTEETITAGAFAGATASIVVATTSSTPHLWAVKDSVLLTIAGGASAQELLRVADSLQDLRTMASPGD
jgi:hypothetical protein